MKKSSSTATAGFQKPRTKRSHRDTHIAEPFSIAQWQRLAILGGNCSDIDHNLRTVTHLVTRLGFVTPICFQPLSLWIGTKRKSVRQNVPIAESYARKLVTAPTSGVSSGRSEPPLSKGVDTLPRLRHDPDVGFRPFQPCGYCFLASSFEPAHVIALPVLERLQRNEHTRVAAVVSSRIIDHEPGGALRPPRSAGVPA